ncbi:lipocalin-like domain-containing protein [Parabacteroides sp. PF5-9]|uniref:lipocalin-like domain-containing protein n=1 Tax=Parabacteroides sp. PF5-9 TaxID=1742404 RepID=UPI0024752E93|nr:lipocalin-like domain-containing protein [Parabacteroides sp. PF5-9]MDH6358318.1 hypothetical protein [Parabacteroides sp. PF5-9]
MSRYLIILCSILLLMISCKKDQKDDLEGKWQLREKICADGMSYQVDTVWYNFQNTLFAYQIYDPTYEKYDGYRRCHGIKQWMDDRQSLLKIRLVSDQQSVEDFLPYTDWWSEEQFFSVEKVNSKELILIRETTKYIFRKF